MKQVIDKINVKVIEVESTDIECSVCRKWKSETSFRREGQDRQSRTNCEDCFNMDWDDMKALSASTEEMIKKKSNSIFNLKSKLEKRQELFGKSVTVKQLRKMLEALDDDDRVYVAEDGYYADGSYVAISIDDHANQEIDGCKFYEIARSEQWC